MNVTAAVIGAAQERCEQRNDCSQSSSDRTNPPVEDPYGGSEGGDWPSRKENLSLVRERLDRIEIVTADLKVWLAGRPELSIDAFSFSNICELMNIEDTARTFEQVARTARPHARICFRNLIIPREVPEPLKSKIQLREDTSRLLLAQDRSFAYSRLHAYIVAGHEEPKNTPDSG
jgi:S-adenosylmethionine:diacylglycerol 3-amino-3-carboxypropyl transferase